ncbi:MAG: hypothetical protein ABI910_21725 [Gemmatimonadota bacterium]
MRRNRLLRWLRNAIVALLTLAPVAVGAVYALSARELARASRAEVPPFTLPLPTDSASLAEGERIAFTRGCIGCHGERLQGKRRLQQAARVKSNAPKLRRPLKNTIQKP